ncbi:MAG: peptide chain release factor N(5)-glutamine methyltransferase [Desulfonatronovibrio sp.]
MPKLTLLSLINHSASILTEAGVDSPRLSSRLIMAFVLGWSQEKLILYPHHHLTPAQYSHFNDLLIRRSSGEPLAYLVGQKEFYGREFAVNRDVLVPRPETEQIIELTVSVFDHKSRVVCLDIGTGSGILAITIALEIPGCQCLGCDISLPALEVARQNAEKHSVLGKTWFLASDMGKGIKSESLDFIVSNPPYLSEFEFGQVSKEVAEFEPRHALVSAGDGYYHFKRLEKTAALILKKQGMVFVEMGRDQGENLKRIFSSWVDVNVHKDLSGHDRILTAVKP